MREGVHARGSDIGITFQVKRGVKEFAALEQAADGSLESTHFYNLSRRASGEGRTRVAIPALTSGDREQGRFVGKLFADRPAPHSISHGQWFILAVNRKGRNTKMKRQVKVAVLAMAAVAGVFAQAPPAGWKMRGDRSQSA